MAFSVPPSLVLLASPKFFFVLFTFVCLFSFFLIFNFCCSLISPRMSENKELGMHKEKRERNGPRSETIARVCITFLSPNLRENKNNIEVNAQYSSLR